MDTTPIAVRDNGQILLENPQGSPRTAEKRANLTPKRWSRTSLEQVKKIFPTESGHFLKVSAARMALGNSDRRVPTKGIHSLDDLRVGINGLLE
jgi:hypothetical protein